MPLSDSAGRYPTRYSSWPTCEDVGVLLVVLRDCTDTVRGKELLLVEHLGEDPAESFGGDQIRIYAISHS